MSLDLSPLSAGGRDAALCRNHAPTSRGALSHHRRSIADPEEAPDLLQETFVAAPGRALRAVQDLSDVEAADILCITGKAVETWVRRARAKLGEQLRGREHLLTLT